MSLWPPLRALHADELLSQSKLAMFEKVSSNELIQSLVPGQGHCLKARRDGTMLDGHHRVYVLRSRSVDVNRLPREIIEVE